MSILALSTSTPRASVALLDGDHLLATTSHDDPRGHAEHLFTLIDRTLSSAGRDRADVHLVACDVGPGSFTGTRIAVSSAKGISLALGVPVVGVVSLEALAAHATSTSPPGALVVAAIDARKDELYLAVYDAGAPLLAPSHVPASDVAARVAAIVRDRPFVTIVDAPSFAAFAPGAQQALVAFPEAAWIARLAAARPPIDPADLAPLYVRAPDAVPTFSGPAGPLAMLPPR